MSAGPDASAPGRLLCIGLGFSARCLAGRLAAAGWTVAGTARSIDRCRAAAARGYRMHHFDRGLPLADPAAVLAPATHLLISAPPDGDGDPMLDAHRADLVRHGSGLRWIGYLSTTGVYGDRAGAWVSEDDPPQPRATRSRRRLAAEQGWLALLHGHGLPVHLFRLAGIYGPGRSQLDAVRAGTARRVVKPGHLFGRIHVEDIATVLQASIARPRPGAVYNVCDDEPAAPAAVTAFACDLLGVAPPPETPYADAEMSPMARSFWADNRRVRNDRIKQELGVTLAYPSYREGLRAVLAADAATD